MDRLSFRCPTGTWPNVDARRPPIVVGSSARRNLTPHTSTSTDVNPQSNEHAAAAHAWSCLRSKALALYASRKALTVSGVTTVASLTGRRSCLELLALQGMS